MTALLVSSSLGSKSITIWGKFQNIIFPNFDICTVENLFFRQNYKLSLNYEQKQAELKKAES